MRLLHTGDWHIGRTIRGRSRINEFSAALDQLVDIATDAAVDAVVIAGDIFDQRAVTPDADLLVFETFVRLHSLGIPMVCIPGNHDSPARLEALSVLLERIGVHVGARVRPPGAGGIVDVPARDGSASARVACLPFVSPRRFADAAADFEDLAGGYVAFDDGLGKLLAAYESAFAPDAVNVVLGHLFVSGAVPGGGERQITLGADYAVSPSRLPATASYVALGHIHRPQAIRGAPGPARYCGSLLQLDFGEREQAKSVVVVDAAPGRRAKTTQVPITAGRPLRDVVGTIEELERIAPDVADAYLRVVVRVERPLPGIADTVRELLPTALDVRLDYDRNESSQPRRALGSLDPKEQFVTYYTDHHGVPPPDELLAAFARVAEEVAV
jgi:DNA repair protein SbcD/Mre11